MVAPISFKYKGKEKRPFENDLSFKNFILTSDTTPEISAG
jgi:hypothetical protein